MPAALNMAAEKSANACEPTVMPAASRTSTTIALLQNKRVTTLLQMSFYMVCWYNRSTGLHAIKEGFPAEAASVVATGANACAKPGLIVISEEGWR